MRLMCGTLLKDLSQKYLYQYTKYGWTYKPGNYSTVYLGAGYYDSGVPEVFIPEGWAGPGVRKAFSLANMSAAGKKKWDAEGWIYAKKYDDVTTALRNKFKAVEYGDLGIDIDDDDDDDDEQQPT